MIHTFKKFLKVLKNEIDLELYQILVQNTFL